MPIPPQPRRTKTLVTGVVLALVLAVSVVRLLRPPRSSSPRARPPVVSSSAVVSTVVIPATEANQETPSPGRVVVTAPRGYGPTRPIPVVIGLHGWASGPEDFSGPTFQRAADRTGVAFVSVSGTQRRADGTFEWSEDVARDRGRIRAALLEASDRVTAKDDAIALLGFSQGAQVALSLVVADPDAFVGAIALSPGLLKLAELSVPPDGMQLTTHRFVISVGGREHPSNVALAERDASVLRAAGANVLTPTYPEQSSHGLPPDFGDAFPRWVRRVLGVP